MNYIKVSSDVSLNDLNVSNIDLYAVCYNEDQPNNDLASVQEFVFNNKDTPGSKYSIAKYTEGSDMILLQRYTSNGERENITGEIDNHVYLVSLIDGETNALNETMKTVLKL